MLESEEYLKRYKFEWFLTSFYGKKDIKSKKQSLLEYYKYHKDIPRLFMKPVFTSINRFHDKRRRLEYARIKRGLGLPDEDEYTKHVRFTIIIKGNQGQEGEVARCIHVTTCLNIERG